MRGTDGRPFVPGDNQPPPWAAPLLSLASLAFEVGARARAACYDAGLLPVHRVGVPVISVGNLRVGGTGKTPFVLLLVEALRARGRRPVVLSRGYGRRPGAILPLVVPAGGPASAAAAERAGDEPVLIARRADVPVVVDPDRVRGARHALDALEATALVMDDGFQHRRLARDLDVVLLDDLDRLRAARLLPRGPLREPPEALDRADLVVFTAGAAPSGFGIPSLRIHAEPYQVGPLRGPPAPPTALAGARVALLSGIARPERFVRTVHGLGAKVVHHAEHPDHAWLTADDVRAFRAAAEAAEATRLVTTEKDAMRLSEAELEGLDVLRVRHRVRAGRDQLEAALDRALGAR